MKKLLLLMFIITLVGCNNEPEYGTIPFTKVNNLPIVSLTINNKHVKLLVDTGANSNILHEPLKTKLGFNVHDSKVVFSGIGGKQNSKEVTNSVLRYRDSIINIQFKASDLTHVRKVLRIDGVIGSEYLNQNDIVIDYKNKKLYKNNN